MRRAFGVEPLGCLDAFKDWAASSPKAVKLDWDATFRSWVRREAAEGRLEPWVPKVSQLGTTTETRSPEEREAALKKLSAAMADLGAKSGLRHTFTGAK